MRRDAATRTKRSLVERLEAAAGWIEARPGPRRALAMLSRPLRYGPRPVLGGAARGLWLDLQGGRLAYLLGTPEPEMQRLLTYWLAPGMVVYDVGANIGFFACIAARRVGPTGQVYAFEPNPSAARALRFNARRNGLDNLTVVEQAIAGRAGSVTFDTMGGSSLQAARIQAKAVSTEHQITVAVTTIDAFVSTGARPPDVVKIDNEGYEAQAIAAMAATLTEHRPRIVVELHSPPEQPGLENQLTAAGYELRWLEDWMVEDRAVWWPLPHLIAEPL